MAGLKSLTLATYVLELPGMMEWPEWFLREANICSNMRHDVHTKTYS